MLARWLRSATASDSRLGDGGHQRTVIGISK
jgi:hypothetical protein